MKLPSSVITNYERQRVCENRHIAKGLVSDFSSWCYRQYLSTFFYQLQIQFNGFNFSVYAACVTNVSYATSRELKNDVFDVLPKTDNSHIIKDIFQYGKW